MIKKAIFVFLILFSQAFQAMEEEQASWNSLPAEVKELIIYQLAKRPETIKSFVEKSLVSREFKHFVDNHPLIKMIKLFENFWDLSRANLLILASMLGDMRALQALIDLGADVNASNEYGKTALFSARHEKLAQLLIDSGALIDIKDSCGYTPLLHGALVGNIKLLTVLHAFNDDLSIYDGCGRTALMLAAQGGHAEVIKFLLSNGASIDAKDHFGQTAFMLALENDHLDVVNLLFASNSDVDKSALLDINALLIDCCQNQFCKINPDFFLRAGADINRRSVNGHTLLMRAVGSGNIEMVTWLLLNGSNVNDRDNFTRTALIQAICSRTIDKKAQKEIIEILLDNGAHVGDSDINGYTPLMVAAYDGNIKIIKLLLYLSDDDCRINAQNNFGQTALMIAIISRHCRNLKKVVKLLIAHNARTDIREQHGLTAIDFAKTEILPAREHAVARENTEYILKLMGSGVDKSAGSCTVS